MESTRILIFSEEEIQSEAVRYFMYQNFLSTGIQVLYSMFLGDWIERNGCKLTMMLPLLGNIISSAYLVVLSQSSLVQAPFILFAAIPVGLTGGGLAFSISCFSYVTRITEVENRSFRIAMVESSAVLGVPIGLLAGSEVLTNTSVLFTSFYLNHSPAGI